MTERRTQAARTQSARDQIVQAALTVFALKGYAAASMDDICLAAGCSKGGLYHHFSTKGAVLAGVVDKMAATGALVPPMPVPDASAAPLGRVLIEIWAECARDAQLRDRLRAGYEAQLDRHLIEDGGGTPLTPAVEGLSQILRIGTLIQMLTQGAAVDAGALARRLGIEQAA